jgi:hypothetical protein
MSEEQTTATDTSDSAMAQAEAISTNSFAAINSSPITSGTALNVDATSSGNSTTADAGSVNSDVLAMATNTMAAGILDSAITSGTDLSVINGEQSEISADATTTTGAATALSNNGDYTPIGGVINSALTAGQNLSLNSEVDNNGSAFAKTVDGTADAAAMHDGSYGVLDSNLSAGANLNASISFRDQLRSAAFSGSGDAWASTMRGEVSGINTEAIEAGGNLSVSTSQPTFFPDGVNTIGGTSIQLANLAASQAETVTGEATALTEVGESSGITATSISGGNDAEAAGETVNQFGAQAVSTTGDATALVDAWGSTGVKADTFSSGTVGGLGGVARDKKIPGPAAAVAFSTSGDVLAEAITPITAGVDVGSVSVGTNGGLLGVAQNTLSSQARTTTGSAEALVAVDEVLGVRVETDASFGTAAEIEAEAIASNGALSTTSDGDATAEVSTPKVIALESPTLRAGTSLSVNALASNNQFAEADTLTGDAKALAGTNETRTVGIRNSALSGGSDSQLGLFSAAELISRSTASTVTGDASTNGGAERDSFTAGIAGSSIEIGGSVLGGMRFEGSSSIEAIAATTTGDATANRNDRVFGARNTNVNVGDTLQLLGGLGLASFVAEGSSTTVASTTTGAADASTILEGAGFKGDDQTVTIQQQGGIVGESRLLGNATADQVNPASTSSDSYSSSGYGDSSDEASSVANVELTSRGLAAAEKHGVSFSIGDTGKVVGLSFADGNSIASSVNGAVEADGMVDSVGIDLVGDISIGATGSVEGVSGVGNWAGTYDMPALTSPFATLASTTTGAADATSSINSVGLDGGDMLSVSAGPLAGNIKGRGWAAASTTASSLNGEVNATNTADLFGIRNLKLTAGQQSGGNSVVGEAIGAFDTTAMTTTGDAMAESNVNGGGIISDEENTLRVNGDIKAVANYSNTVLASTVTGLAVAKAVTNAVGISGYEINVLQNGNIVANVGAGAVANAQNVSGPALSYN